MYRFKTDLMENEERHRLFRRLAGKLGLGWVYDGISKIIGPNGQSIGRNEDGYWQHYHNDSPTNISHPEDGTFINMLKGWFGFGKKKKK